MEVREAAGADLASLTSNAWRRLSSGRVRRAQERVAASTAQAHDTVTLFAEVGVGSAAGRWDAFSSAGGFHMEKTLEIAQYREPTLAPQCRSLLSELPAARLAAHSGNEQVRDKVHEQVLQLAAAGPDRAWRQLLHEHLPGHLRPVPDNLTEIDRTNGPRRTPVTVSVTEPQPRHGAGRSVMLHHLVVSREHSGHGLGTAALVHLCRYADQQGVPITGELNPGPGHADDPERLRRTANWYARHGFSAGHRDPDKWPLGCYMRREPAVGAA